VSRSEARLHLASPVLAYFFVAAEAEGCTHSLEQKGKEKAIKKEGKEGKRRPR